VFEGNADSGSIMVGSLSVVFARILMTRASKISGLGLGYHVPLQRHQGRERWELMFVALRPEVLIECFQLKMLSSMVRCRSGVVDARTTSDVSELESKSRCDCAMMACTQTVDSIAVAVTLERFISVYINHKGNHDQHRAGNASKAASCRELRELGS